MKKEEIVKLLNFLVDAGYILLDSNNKNNIIVYRKDYRLDEIIGFSENINDVAKEVESDDESKDALIKRVNEILEEDSRLFEIMPMEIRGYFND